jgi:Spy/CpxP family protein refolding chaperone
MKKIITLILFCAALFPAVVFSQEKDKPHRTKADFEKLQQERVEYISKAMKLTDDEAKVFWTVCFEYWQKKFEADRQFRHKIRQFMQDERDGKAHTENDYKQIVEIFADKKLKEAELEKEYMQKFLEILPAEKVFLFQGAEQDFLREMLNKRRDNNHDKPKK